MAYKTGRFVWFELVTTNIDDAKAFWTEVGGFGTSTFEMGGPKPYLMLTGPGGTIGGVTEPRMEGVPPHFSAYLSVADVDATAKKVVANGGKVIVPGSDTPIGRFAVVEDPQGAKFQLWHDKVGDDKSAAGVNWVELWAKNADAVIPFYQAVFGLGHDEMSMPTGPYHILKAGADNTGGVMTSPQAKAPPMWLAYLEVADVDAAVAKVRSAGGAVHAEPMTVEGVGKFAIVADRQGVVAGLIKPAAR